MLSLGGVSVGGFVGRLTCAHVSGHVVFSLSVEINVGGEVFRCR